MNILSTTNKPAFVTNTGIYVENVNALESTIVIDSIREINLGFVCVDLNIATTTLPPTSPNLVIRTRTKFKKLKIILYAGMLFLLRVSQGFYTSNHFQK